tara:strand:+ start:2795 stop:3205 length:411 start_codon:yes stop_codon:yes gene_type:complete
MENSKLYNNNYNDDYNNLLNMSSLAQNMINNKVYDLSNYTKIIEILYYYNTCICFDCTNEIYSYLSMKNIKQFHNIDILFNSIMNKVEIDADKYYLDILKSFVIFTNIIIKYMNNFDNNQKYNINIIINKIVKLSI